MPSPAFSRPRLDALTSMRFFAALHVFAFHTRAIMSNGAKIPVSQNWFGRLAGIGYVGVSFFFVLSGFVLVYTYGDRPVTAREFWRARFARVYPAYLFSLFLTFPFYLYLLSAALTPEMKAFGAEWWQLHPATTSVSVLALLQSWNPKSAMAWNAVAWSLSCEAFFYLAFPLLLRGLQNRSAHVLLTVGGICWAAMLGATVLYTVYSPDGVRYVSSDDNALFWLNFIKFNPLMRAPEFIMGVVAGLWFLRAPKLRYATAWALGALAIFAVAVQYSNRIPYPVLHTGLLAPVFSAMVLALGCRPAWSRVLEAKPLVVLGDASYSLYLLHSTVISGFIFNAKGWFARSDLAPLAPLAVATTIAYLVFRFIETPARRRLRSQPQPPPALAFSAEQG